MKSGHSFANKLNKDVFRAIIFSIYPPVAQLDNATDSDSGEREFKSLRAGHKIKGAPFGASFVL